MFKLNIPKLLKNKPCSTFTSAKLSVNFFCDKRFREIAAKYKPMMEKFSKENEEESLKEAKSKLNEEQTNYIELLADKFASLNHFQLAYFNNLMEEELIMSKKYTRYELHTNWESITSVESKVENLDQAYFEQQEYMSQFTDWLSKQPKVDLGLGLGAAAPQAAPVVEEKKEEVKKEEKKEKAIYDVELSSFDAAKKIALIKEVRAYTNLGLKEAKELVEKAPVVIMKGIKKEDTEAIIKKLSDIGAKITLK